MTAYVRTGTDAWVSSDTPSLNTGSGKWLRLVDPGTRTRYAFLHVKNPAPRGATILSATLKLRGAGSIGDTYQVDVQRAGGHWAEEQVDWDNQPSVFGSVASVTQTETADATLWEFDVTALVQTMTNNGLNCNFRISTPSTTERKFYSFNATDHHPVLEVDWDLPPDTPTELSPAGGSTVTIAKPVLSFNFHDVAGSTAMASCQVQINPINVFTSPAFDSGEVSTSDPELDLSTTAYAGLAVGDDAYWRVRVKDAAGLWSAWSDPARFSRVARGALTIDSPTGGVVNDPTQEIIWTLSGATQTSWRVTVWDESNPTIPIHDTGRRAGTANHYTLPKGVITSESTTYRLRVRVWDVLTRVSTPTDLVHTEAVETFVFAEDPTPNPFTDLTVALAVAGQPAVKLTVQRATAPDYVSVWRDGQLIAHNLDPADLIVSGTTYAFIDYTAESRLTHVYKVRPKVSGKLGPAVSGTFTFVAPEVWLMHPGSGRMVPIKRIGNDEQITFDAPQAGSSHLVQSGKHVVRVYQSQMGLQGPGRGVIIDCAGDTAANWVANMQWMQDHPKTKVRLLVGQLNFNVVLSDVVIAPYANGDPHDMLVSFTFWSQSVDW
jgi:hypothetical protein